MWQYPAGAKTVNNLLGISSYAFMGYDSSAGFVFTVPLQDGAVQAVNTTITNGISAEAVDYFDATLQLILQHTPK